MVEEQTYEAILQRMMDRIPDGMDKRKAVSSTMRWPLCG